LFASNNAGDVFTAALFQDSTANALAADAVYMTANRFTKYSIVHRMAAGTTSSTTFKVRAGSNSASTTTLNGYGGTQYLGGKIQSSITIYEILA